MPPASSPGLRGTPQTPDPDLPTEQLAYCSRIHILLRPREGCKVIWWVWVSVCLSVRWHNSKTTRPNFTKFLVHVACGRWSVHSLRRCQLRSYFKFSDRNIQSIVRPIYFHLKKTKVVTTGKLLEKVETKKISAEMIGRYGPSVATCATGTPVLCDMKPRTEKMTKPPRKLVAQLITDTSTESLHGSSEEITATKNAIHNFLGFYDINQHKLFGSFHQTEANSMRIGLQNAPLVIIRLSHIWMFIESKVGLQTN